jgi:hypothetical protein
MKVSQEGNCTMLDLESDGAFSAFRMGLEDRRQWSRHPETTELKNYVIDHAKSEYIAVRYKDAVVRVK